MNFYVYVYKGIANSFYFCPKVLEIIFKSFETESTRFGSKYVYCRHLVENRDKQRLALKQSEIGDKCWYCRERLWVFAKPAGKIDVMYICPAVANLLAGFFEYEQKKLEWKIFCQPSQRASELIAKK